MANIGSTVGKDIKNDTQDEIDMIMNEIESLQKELGSVETTADAIMAGEPVTETAPKEAVMAEKPTEVPVVEPQTEPSAPVETVTPAASADATNATDVADAVAATEAEIMAEIDQAVASMSMDQPVDPAVVESTASAPEVMAEAAVETVEASPVPIASDEMAEFRGSGGDAGMEETLGELQQEPTTGTTILDQMVSVEEMTEEKSQKGAIMAVQEIETSPASSSIEGGSLSMTLTGNMTLKLNYEYEGEQVAISFVDQALMVQLSDGTEFKIPVRRRPALRRVA